MLSQPTHYDPDQATHQPLHPLKLRTYWSGRLVNLKGFTCVYNTYCILIYFKQACNTLNTLKLILQTECHRIWVIFMACQDQAITYIQYQVR